jgi:hypothetical protein
LPTSPAIWSVAEEGARGRPLPRPIYLKSNLAGLFTVVPSILA